MNLDLRGIIPPMITPLTAEGDLDEKGLKNLIEHLIAGGVHGIFLLGTNGEAPSLTYATRMQLITKACEYIDKRVPVLVGITDTNFQASIDMTAHSKASGADAVVVAPPYYFPISENEMIDYLECLVPKLSLPFVLYNMPSCTKMHMSITVVRKAKELGALGIKDSSGDLEYLYTLIDTFQDSPDFAIIAGTESFLSKTMLRGGHGAVAGGANFFPNLFVDLYHASVRGENAVIEQLNKKVNYIYDTIYSVGKYESRITKGTKCALSVMNICEDHMAMPLRKLNDEERARIKDYVDRLKGELVTPGT
ncbi:dihydrodipicolinate synthase family protein [Pareuzebyella sediminis]|uniref:dihydrodipicolinate synthase family protein n=1 Tax=Pareuzebyella sediminis TaxID=2607998 RepID=UPI0011EBBAFC|nr:dihydrodipicolinate synthase family protein [Pareuzebyella sediminis]